jgi:DNA-binding NarL/FixJ family response regulator
VKTTSTSSGQKTENIEPNQGEDVRDGFPAHCKALIETLTSRETSVLALVFNGSTSREAGKLLAISPRTVEFHRANIMQKFGAANVAELMRILFSNVGAILLVVISDSDLLQIPQFWIWTTN